MLRSRVTAGYFAAIGLALEEGRDFDLLPPSEGQRFAVVSRDAAERFWRGEHAIGQRFKFGRPESDAPWFEVIGVVGDVLHNGLAQDSQPTIYVNERAMGMSRARFVVRSQNDPETVIAQLRGAVEEIDPNQPIWGERTLASHVAEDAWQERFFATAFWIFALVAALLSAIGLFSVLSFAVSVRKRELGVRLALGSTNRGVASLILSDGVRLVGIGLLLGVPLALLAGRGLASVLFGVSTFDPVVLSATVLVQVVAGCWRWPFLRAARRSSTLRRCCARRGSRSMLTVG